MVDLVVFGVLCSLAEIGYMFIYAEYAAMDYFESSLNSYLSSHVSIIYFLEICFCTYVFELYSLKAR